MATNPYSELLKCFFVLGVDPTDEGWVRVNNYDAWTHPETSDVVTGHQMRAALNVGMVPKVRLMERPWL